MVEEVARSVAAGPVHRAVGQHRDEAQHAGVVVHQLYGASMTGLVLLGRAAGRLDDGLALDR
jgi:hypothetical protein